MGCFCVVGPLEPPNGIGRDASNQWSKSSGGSRLFPARFESDTLSHKRPMDPNASGEEIQRRILLIDDSVVALKALRTVLGLHPSWQIVGEAENGPAGLALFRETNPNVVIIDFQMPGMTGIEVGREIRRSDADVLMILFTLHAGAEVERMASEAGFDAVMSKSAPYPIVAIIEKMKAERPQRTRLQETAPESEAIGPRRTQ